MNAGKRFSPIEFILWTRRTIYKVFILSLILTLCYFLGANFISLPWQPIAILGTAVAFIVGFKNNASYARLIWVAGLKNGKIAADFEKRGAVTDGKIKLEDFAIEFPTKF